MSEWIEAFVAVSMVALIVVFWWRGRQARRELAECRTLLHRLSECSRRGETGDDAERFRRSQYFARIGTWDWDVDTEKLYWSEAIYGMFGYKVDEVVPSYELFCASVHPDDRDRVRAGELRCIETGENHDEEYRVIWPDGSIHWLRETGNVVKNVHDSVVKMMGVVRDITEEKAWASQLHTLAHNDALTGLPNRLVLEERLCRALERARDGGTRVILVFLDLNGFKEINDAHGHAAGDQILIATANRLKNLMRVSDTVARIGGDEFVLIFEGLAQQGIGLSEEIHRLCGKVLIELSVPISLDEQPIRIGSSLGVAVFPDHAVSMDTLIHIADLAMYDAKRSGNNQYRLGRSAVLAAGID
ncbi:sensor domain-containing diguanylate cyclase [Pseudomonas asplenii]|uniref:PAS domain S-box/diguanylate cyclase (GGDEF) domain-containing protein n=1 Tax=Pseudomonas asplenii TaxID=53407 RepID=A0A0M9GHI0_9PSED|nr:sensor domain-containing diguanylate cyclase [Pseudomonas fuscovaginae]KPA91123.1 PAS domain S-box/diguanylate cyclase (GGDEF) domain-containing protein [Pseudomonas fuscovaginae]KPA97966.1 PAS domain S-box/diguanylate cyclase (GGDEF) domain-containing protein [Pseudomonas fuscovaginae]